MGLGLSPTQPKPSQGRERNHPRCQTSPLERKRCPGAGSQAPPGQDLTFSTSVLVHTWDNLSRVMSAAAANAASPQVLPSLVTGTVLSNEFGFNPYPVLYRQVLWWDGVCR